MNRCLVLTWLLLASPLLAQTAATGLGVNVPLLGKLKGAGGVLYSTALDVANLQSVSTQVDYYLDGIDVVNGMPIRVVGSIADAGFTDRGSGVLSANRSVHFDDFVSALASSGRISALTAENGFLGSVLFVFGGAAREGQAAVLARFHNPSGLGTVGVSLKGHVIGANESQTLTAVVRDTRGQEGVPQTYANLFLNNTGLTPGGSPTSDPVTVQLSALSAATGRAVGTPNTLSIASGRTVGFGVFPFLQVSGQGTLIVTAQVISGAAAIHGVVSQVDDGTKDGSAFEMTPKP